MLAKVISAAVQGVEAYPIALRSELDGEAGALVPAENGGPVMPR